MGELASLSLDGGSASFYSSPELSTVTGEQVPGQGLPQTPSPPSLKGQ